MIGRDRPSNSQYPRASYLLTRLQRRMCLLDGIARGEKAVEDGRLFSQAQAKQRLRRWLK